MSIHAGKIAIGPSERPFIIAEMSGNHNGSLERALEIVDAVAASGASALKIQTYTADTMTIDLREREFLITDPNSLWKGHSLYELYEKAHTPWEWHEAIFERCRKKGIVGFSTPFDATAVDFLERFNPPLYKIASFENIDLALIKKCARTGKPLIISTGMATAEEIGEAVDAARCAGANDVVLLKCTSAYPAEAAEANLATMHDMRKKFSCEVGLSDHTLGIGVSLAAIALGAVAIERHVTLRRSDGGVDSAFSLEPAELKTLVEEGGRARESRGHVHYGPLEKEKASLVFRRSLYVVKNVKKGETITAAHVRAIRPGYGLAPKHLESLIGKIAARDIAAGTPARTELFE